MTRKPDRRSITDPTLEFEKAYWQEGIDRVAGIDEAGRGALAGPVCAAAVILPKDLTLGETLRGVRDSKQMSPAQRELWAPRIKDAALTWGVGFATEEEIDMLGILRATKLAATRALGLSAVPAQALLSDALILPEIDLPQTALIKGDQRALSVAAASVLAKTSRDALLCQYEGEYPGYGFARHKGYGTRAHCLAVQRLGLCAIHRRSFRIPSPKGTTNARL